MLIPCLAALLGGVAMPAQTPAPKPGPEHKAMQLLAGNWTYEREFQATPLGPATRQSAKCSSREILNGFFIEYQHTMKGPEGDGRWMEIDGYDPVAKTNVYAWFGDFGGMGRGTFRISGNTSSWEGTGVMAGVQYRDRGTVTLSADGMSYTKKSEITLDGKTWVLWYADKGKRVKAAAQSFSAEHPPAPAFVTVNGIELCYNQPFKVAERRKVERELRGVKVLEIPGTTHAGLIFQAHDRILAEILKFLRE